MGLLDWFKKKEDAIPKEVVRAVVKRSEKVRARNDEFHEAITDLLRRMNEQKGQRHVEDN